MHRPVGRRGAVVAAAPHPPTLPHPPPFHVQYFQLDSIEKKKTEVLFDRFVLFAEQKNFWTIRQVESSIRQFISLVRGTPCKFVDSVDSFYSANGNFYVRPYKQSFDLFDPTNGKYYARSYILCSPSENCISLVTMTPCKFVDSADSFYSTNRKFHLRPDKWSFDLFHSTNGNYYA